MLCNVTDCESVAVGLPSFPAFQPPILKRICAFIRQTEEIKLIVIAPRWFSRLITASNTKLPLGEAAWGNATWIEIMQPGPAVKNHGLNLLTGETVTITEINGTVALAASDALRSFPVALVRI
ncbi:hypothetical protein [Nitrosomonas sp. wSCUT-2]